MLCLPLWDGEGVCVCGGELRRRLTGLIFYLQELTLLTAQESESKLAQEISVKESESARLKQEVGTCIW